MPAPPEDVLSFAAKLLNKEDPPIVDFLSANLSDMVRSFYSECKRVDNSKIKSDLQISLKYPNYKIGLKSVLKEANLSLWFWYKRFIKPQRAVIILALWDRNSYPLAATPTKSRRSINSGDPPDEDEADTTGSSILGVAIEPAEREVAASENAAANRIFFISFSKLNYFYFLP